MKPIELTMTAFGPYSKTETVDFTKIQGESLFLITGPTGSGKTTIFDAISYALYGESSGNIRSGESLKSGYSSGEEVTAIAFKFLLRGKEYSILRSPKQAVKKSRGEGFTIKTGYASLEMAGDKTPIVGYKNVTDKIEEIIGLNARQFRQIMMIPQGSFQEMLNSNSGDREEILKTLFDTEIFSSIQRGLKERGNFLEIEIKESLARREAILQGVHAPNNEELLNLIGEKNPAMEEVLPLIEEEISLSEKGLKFGEASAQELDKRRKKEISKRERAIQDNERAERYETLKKRALELEQQSQYFAEMGEEILKLKAAREVLPVEKEFRDVEKKVKEIITRLETSERTLKVHQEDHGKLESELSSLESEEARENERELQEKIARMKRYAEKLTELRVKKNEEESLEEKCNASRDTLSKLESKQKKQEQEIANLHLKLKEAYSMKDEIVSIDRDIQEHRVVMEKLSEAGDTEKTMNLLQNEIEKVQIESKKLLDINEKLREARNQIQERRQKNMLASLADSLSENTPCPLCGSTNHPHPAKRIEGKEEEREEEIEAIDEKLAINEKHILELNGKLGQHQGTRQEKEKLYKNLQEVIKNFALEKNREDLSFRDMLDKMEKNSEKLKETRASLETHLKEIPKQEALVEKLENELSETEQSLKVQSRSYNENMGSLKSIKEIIKSLINEIPQEFLQIQEMNILIKKHEEELMGNRERLETLRKKFTQSSEKNAALRAEANNLLEQKESLSQELENRRKELKTEVFNRGFSGYEEYSECKVEKNIIEGKEASLKEYENERERINAQIEILENGEPIPPKVSLESFDAQISQIEGEIARISGENTLLKSSILKNQEILNKIKENSKTTAKLEEEFYTMGKLSRTAEGQNDKRLSFERYILTAFLNDIISAANVRLYKMSSSRYKLKRSAEVEDKRSSSGLELMVRDHYTGLDRHVNTLSGGESFKASLAMALGLSDVVQEYSGGVQLDTMFIDEGFGSLDPESLDQAMNCLAGIQKTGRLVGIISHVPDLKERIKTQLRVIPSDQGSRTNNFDL